MSTQNDLFITDLPDRVVGGFTPAKGVGRGWVTVEYETAEFNGAGLATGFDSGAPELTLRLDLEGEYILYLGLAPYSTVRVWLDGEEGFVELECGHGGFRFQEARLHAADLTGRCLHIAPVPAIPNRHADACLFLGYLRAKRIDHAAAASARNMVGTNDGFSWIALDGMESVRDVTKHFTPYRDSDFRRVLWCPCGADVTGNHLSKVGTVMPFDATDAFRRCDRLFHETIARILPQGDILAEATKAAREVGVEFHFYIRPEAFYAPFPYDGSFTSDFLSAHPEWRCRDEFSREVQRMSYTYPEVQDHMLAYVEELLQYGPGGVCYAFNRSLPLMICEEPVLAAFRARYGRDPKLPEECDAPEMLAVRQEILAGFLTRLHSLLADHGAVLSALVDPDDDANKLFGLDLEMLLQRGLLESVYSTGYCPSSPYWQRLRDAYPAVPIYSSVYYGHTTDPQMSDPFNHQAQAAMLKSVLDAGFAGVFYWDIETMFKNPYNWHVFRHGGSRPFLDRVLAGDTEVQPVFRTIEAVRGVRLDRYNPMRSY